MKILTISTPNYKALMNRMLIGLIYHSTKEPIDITIDQSITNEEGVFGTKNFNLICKYKAQQIYLQMSKMRRNDILFYIDGDIQLFEDVKWFENMFMGHNIDMVAQNDNGGICAGFFLAKVTPLMLALWHEVAKETSEAENDQIVLNRVITKYIPQLKVSLLPTNMVAHYGAISNGDLWNGQEFKLPEGCKAFHANFTIGMENKIKLLDYVVKQKYAN